jgi:prolyl oligopeptidase PreP (S9A serine peptidase family)
MNRMPQTPFDYDGFAKQMQEDLLHAIVRIVDTHNRMLIHFSEQPSSPASTKVVDSYASEEVEDANDVPTD